LHYGIVVRGMPKDEDFDFVKLKARRFAGLIKKLKVET
jgi:hypothetical protein